MKMNSFKIYFGFIVFGAFLSCSDAPTPRNTKSTNSDNGTARVQDENKNEGDTEGGTVTDPVTGEETKSSASDKTLSLSWDANSDNGLTGYSIYGYLGDPTTAQKVSSVLIDALGFDLNSPSLELTVSSKGDLKGYVGKNACFFVRAVNDSGASDGSEPVCLQL